MGAKGADTALSIEAPRRLEVIVRCPSCDREVGIPLELGGRLTKDTDGSAALSVKAKAVKVAHLCEQMTLLPAADR